MLTQTKTTPDPVTLPKLRIDFYCNGKLERSSFCDDPRRRLCNLYNADPHCIENGYVAVPVTEPVPPLMVEVVGGKLERMVVAFDDPRQVFCEDYAKFCEAGRTVRILHNPKVDDVIDQDFRRSSFAAATTEGGGK